MLGSAPLSGNEDVKSHSSSSASAGRSPVPPRFAVGGALLGEGENGLGPRELPETNDAKGSVVVFGGAAAVVACCGSACDGCENPGTGVDTWDVGRDEFKDDRIS